MAVIRPVVDRKVRFALVGCGRIAKNHIEAIAFHSEKAHIVDVCDIESEVLLNAKKMTNARGHNSIQELLKDTNADAVILTTPSGIHAEHAILAAESGLHVVCEKPMAVQYADGIKMVKACERANVQLFVVKQNRRNSTIQLLKKSIDNKRFGKIYLVNINVFWQRPQEYYDMAPWRGTLRLDGGAFMNQASHYVDLLQWLFGPVQSVHTYTATLARNIEAEDTGVMNLEWQSGTLGTMNVTMLTYPKNIEGSITVLGEKGTVIIGGVAVNKILRWEFKDRQPEDKLIDNASYETTSIYGFGHSLYYENVIDTLLGTAMPETDGYSGLKTLELLEALYLSSKKGGRVSLPLVEGYGL
jgi:UDP-N-acetyl-2-amino-2-deoxyglucuronate dehydrogenase